MRCEASRKIHVEFDEVETGATAVKWLEIVNESCVSVRSSYLRLISSYLTIPIELRLKECI